MLLVISTEVILGIFEFSSILFRMYVKSYIRYKKEERNEKTLVCHFVFITMLTGCSVKDVNWYPISQEVMATTPKELPFPISYPTKLPFEVDSITVTNENAEHVTVVYSSKDNQNLIVEITRGKDVFPQNLYKDQCI